jgi:SAM-dependent methyltransferase
MFLERGILNSLVIAPDSRVLDLCCGDGFFAHRFYGHHAREVVAIDRDSEAIRFATRYNAASNVRYVQGDVTDPLPEGPFDNVIWDATIQYFELDEIRAVCRSVRNVLAANGVLSGYTIVEPATAPLFEYHHTRFADASDLVALLGSEFQAVRVVETRYPARHNLYFFAAADDSSFSEQLPPS